MEGVEKNSKWPQVERQIDLGMEEQWKNDGTEKRMAQAWWKPDRAVKRHLQTSQKSWNRRIDEMHGQQIQGHTKTRSSVGRNRSRFSTYSVKNQLDKRSFWSWKPFVASWISSQNRNHSFQHTQTHTHTIHLLSIWLASFLLLLRSLPPPRLSPMAPVLR